jgi:hypothetical protein
VLIACVVGGLLVTVAPAGGAGTGLPACADADLVPQIADLQVSQGAPGYARLTRGKTTIVKAYLTLPTACAVGAGQSITPTDATLSVSNPNGVQTLLHKTNAFSGTVGSTQQINSSADPYFVVPATYLRPTGTGTFNLGLTVQVTYTRLASRVSTTNLTTSTTATNAVKSVPVDQQTRALRILVVPMGDQASTATQWSSTAQTTLQNIMTNASRAYAVPDGTGDMSSTATGGIRYVVSGGLLDVKLLGLYATSGTSSKFCGTASNWSTSQVSSGTFAGHTLKGDLLQRLADYNKYNVPPADMVLGVVDGAVAWKSADSVTFNGSACDDGRAATPSAGQPGQVAWARVDTGTYPSPVQMEVLHTLGISTLSLTLHSPNVEADAAGRDKGWNPAQLKLISTATGALGTNDHSIMNYNTTSVPYTKDNTLLEPQDQADILCDLGGLASATATPYANCPVKTAIGTALGVGGGSSETRFQISGTIVNGAVKVTESQTVDVDPGDKPVGVGDVTSPLQLVELDSASTVLSQVPLALLPDEGHDDLAGGVDTSPSPVPGFAAVVPISNGATTIDLRYNGTRVYTVSTSASAPDITNSASVAPGSVLKSFSLAGSNGRAVAFDGTYLYTTLDGFDTKIYKFTTDGTLVATIDVGTTIGALAYNSATGHLYGGNYTNTGDVYDIDPTDGSKTTLFAFNDTSCEFGKYIDGLEYLGGGNLAISGDLCQNVFFKKVADGSDAAPSFATSDPNSGITTDGSGGLWLALLNPSQESSGTVLVHRNSAGNFVEGDQLTIPNYEAEDLAYDSVTFAPTCAIWMNEATQGSPQIRAIAVPCGGQSSTPTGVEVTTTNTKYVSAYVTCGDPNDITNANVEKFPIADGLVPNEEGNVVIPYTPSLACASGSPTVFTIASNGYATTSPGDAQAQVTVSPPSHDPTAAIAAPLDGATYRLGDRIHFEGSGWDFEDGDLSGSTLVWTEGTTQRGTGKSFDLSNLPAGDHAITLTATDKDGHTGSASVTIHINGDVKPPVLTLTQSPIGNEWVTTSPVTVSITASDNASGDSGLASVKCSLDSTSLSLPAIGNPAATYSASTSVSTDGIHTVACTAIDRAANETAGNLAVYLNAAPCVGGPGHTVLSPVMPDGSSVFKKGTTIPIKFRVCDASGKPISTPIVTFPRTPPPVIPSASAIPSALRDHLCATLPNNVNSKSGAPVFCGVVGSVSQPTPSTTPNTVFRYDPTNKWWVFNQDTSTNDLVAGNAYVYYIPLIDGTNIFYVFGLK